MSYPKIFFIILIIFGYYITQKLTVAADTSKLNYIKLKKINCTVFDKTAIHFDKCFLKAVNRDTQYLTVQYRNLKLPITKFSVRLNPKYRANGWKTFFYDVTLDICQFTRHANSPIGKMFFNTIGDRNRFKCPIQTSEETFENITNKRIAAGLGELPIPSGDYALFTTWYINNIMSSTVDVYITVSEKL